MNEISSQHGAHNAPAVATAFRQEIQRGGNNASSTISLARRPNLSSDRFIIPAIRLLYDSFVRIRWLMGNSPEIFDRQSYAMARARAEKRGGDAFLVREAAAELAARLSTVKRTFADGLALDLRSQGFELIQPFAQNWTHWSSEHGETLGFAPEQFDIAVSLLSLHAMNDLPGMLIQIRRALRPDGLFVAAMFGGSTLAELREAFAAGESETVKGASPRIAPFADVKDIGNLLQRAGFALPVADTERTQVLYENFDSLIRDLRDLGETNVLAARHKQPLKRATLAASLSHYTQYHTEADGRLRATFDIIYLAGWAPHGSQQKPLKPGSALSRLADVLKPKP
jgi:SAM-dependent methyltransferase